MSGLGAWAFKMRGGLWTLLFVLILVLARPTPRSLAVGLIFVVLGQLWRFWAAGSIGRYRGESVGAERLATWGPYALMRNPLYFGNGLIGLGWAIMAGPWAVPLFILGFIILYGIIIIPCEEAFLLEKFGEAYRAYQRTTGIFFPRREGLSSLTKRLHGPFCTGVLWQSETHTVLSTVVGTCLIALKITI
ncbi:MAG: isoprenylcysteine carboxylmethyltransferase family protein [Fretibacterium sp.]|nr:isoprenylcysteine carboxylmethyltransferase family protein [Fretibacterium sp.]